MVGGQVKVNIKGDVNLYTGGSIRLNTGLTKTVVDTTDVGTYIGGIINLVGGTGDFLGTNPTIYLTSRASSSTTTVAGSVSVVSCNGVNGNGIVYGSVSETYPPVGGMGVLHLRNSGSNTFIGWLRDGGVAPLMLIMDGEGSQYFGGGGGAFKFTGGIEVRNGLISFNGRDTAASQSHGKLTMSGGTFQIASSTVKTASGSFGFSSFDYKSGTIALNINDTAADIIKLTDGTIVALDGMSDFVNFKLTGNLALLEENWVKIVEWTKITDIAEDKFAANSYNGKNAVFDVRDDGLYVMYSAIPEPSIVAAAFGAIALAFAAYRKRRS